MNDDWRVQVTCPTAAIAANLSELLREGDFQHELQGAAGERVIVSLDGNLLFLYAGDRAQAEKAIAAVTSLVSASDQSVQTQLRRWHPVAEEWVDADQPLPELGSGALAEHAEMIAQERAEQSQLDYAEWEVRVSTESHRDAVELSDALRRQGIANMRRWRYLVVGAGDEDAANALAERVRGIAPADARVAVEASAPAVEAEMPGNPFAVFGGLGG
jgi:hypothetical protein